MFMNCAYLALYDVNVGYVFAGYCSIGLDLTVTINEISLHDHRKSLRNVDV